MRHTPNLLEEAYKDNGKNKVVEFEIGTCSKPSDIEEDPGNQEVIESLS